MTGNYNITYTDNTVSTITKAPLTLNAANDTKVYDTGTSSTGAVTPVGLQIGDSVTSLTQNYLSKNVLGANLSTLDVNAGYAVNDGNSGGNYTVTTNSATGTITAAPLAIAAQTDSKTYSGTNTSSVTPTVTTPLGAGDTVSNLAQTFDSANAGARILSVSAYTINDGNSGNNYLPPTLSTANGSISTAALSVTANNASQTYNGVTYTGGNGVVYSGFVNSETPSVLGGTLTYSGSSQGARNAGSYALIPGGQTSSNYALSFVNGVLNINQAPLDIKADDASKLAGTLNPPFTATYIGLVPGDTPNSLDGSLLLSTSATTASPVGLYPITPSGVTATNYTIQFVDSTLAVAPNGTKPITEAITAINFNATELTAAGAAGSSFDALVGSNPTGAGDSPDSSADTGDGSVPVKTVVEIVSTLVTVNNCGVKPPDDAPAACSPQ